MGESKDFSEFIKGQLVTSGRLGQSISKTAALVGCSWFAVVTISYKCSKEGTVVNRRQGRGQPRLIDAHGERRLVRVVRSNRRGPVAHTAVNVRWIRTVSAAKGKPTQYKAGGHNVMLISGSWQ
ncbi:hypothetical protein C0J45_17042 [Silurus meridionalis]|uniref:Uncharacterized protein n=1 Tax=Silurus meridionalis TaxID=175797 RepID=A0A8T0AKZ8_SILME|nr:hypothetical protein HF521_009976 [Silurus meridionalis]KAI5092651.1 hypothetical protein C0J45_17042 [Silurus meridionalis]